MKLPSPTLKVLEANRLMTSITTLHDVLIYIIFNAVIAQRVTRNERRLGSCPAIATVSAT
jgi:hypothetical protein